MAVDNGILGTHFSTWMLHDNVICRKCSYRFSQHRQCWSLWSLSVMHVLHAASIYMQESTDWGEMTRLRVLVLFTVEEPANFFYRIWKRPVFWSTLSVLKHCSLTIVFFRYCYNSLQSKGNQVSVLHRSLILIAMTPDTGFPYSKVAWRKL